ncbi:hypothetical protein BH11ACT6_BH11ACT6_44380 [soil metagenome]
MWRSSAVKIQEERAKSEQSMAPAPDVNQYDGQGSGDRSPGQANAGATTSPWGSVAGPEPLLSERVLVIDDCTLFRDNLVAVLVLNGFATPAVAWDLPSLVAALADASVRIVLLNMRSRGSHLLLSAAKEMNPALRVVALGASEADEAEVVACAEAGVWGYHMRTDTLNDLIVLVHNVATGMPSCPPRVSAILLRRLSSLASQAQPEDRELALTAREIQILRMLELGRSNRDIATHLSIAIHTVKNHVHSVLTKLGVSTRAEAAALSRTMRIDTGSTRRN